MDQYVLTLIYPDGTKWIAGGFASLDAANEWVAEQQKGQSWVAGTQTQIDTVPMNPPPA